MIQSCGTILRTKLTEGGRGVPAMSEMNFFESDCSRKILLKIDSSKEEISKLCSELSHVNINRDALNGYCPRNNKLVK